MIPVAAGTHMLNNHSPTSRTPEKMVQVPSSADSSPTLTSILSQANSSLAYLAKQQPSPAKDIKMEQLDNK
jgi:hypothetical protein